MRFKLTLTFVSVALLSGCVAYHIPTVPPPNRVHGRQLTLGIERSQRTVSHQYQYAHSFISEQELIDVLQTRAAFKQVDFLERLTSAPDIVMKDSFFGSYRNFYEPMQLIISAGIIPQVYKNPYLLEFELVDRRGALICVINRKQEDTFIEGWIALPLMLSPHWSAKQIDNQIVDRFAAEIEKAAYESAKKQ